MAPLNSLPVQPVDWGRDRLPELIWMDLLAQRYGEPAWISVFHAFLDVLQQHIGPTPVMHGYISEFGMIPFEIRSSFLNSNYDQVLTAFYDPAGKFLKEYPDFPGNWLFDEQFDSSCPRPDRTQIAETLTQSVVRLLPSKDGYVGHLRVLPFARHLMAGRITIPAGLEVVDLMKRYPGGCSDEEKVNVQQFARTAMNVSLHAEGLNPIWPKAFWRHNQNIIPCVPHGYTIVSPAKTLLQDIEEKANRNAIRAYNYLTEIARNYKCDLYEPERDEILLGLFSRVTRLFFRMFTDRGLWSRDLAGIMLRCIVDTAITFIYLVRKGSDEHFRDFRAYGEGKQKLLMLHLQDTYPGMISVNGQTAEQIGASLGGGISPELIDIELSNWTNKSARDLAIEMGLEEFYRIAYDPASSDVHGTWISLDHSNLTRCIQPLHRFHRMPGFFEPPASVRFLQTTQRLYVDCATAGHEVLGFSTTIPQLEEIAE